MIWLVLFVLAVVVVLCVWWTEWQMKRDAEARVIRNVRAYHEWQIEYEATRKLREAWDRHHDWSEPNPFVSCPPFIET